MLSIPFLEGFFDKKVKKSTVADFVDHLNYYVTSYLLGIFALALAGKQYFGNPIQCWAPSEFKDGWQKYAEDYCFIANAYHVPFDQYHMPKVGSPERGDNHSYYRWVPMVLAIQAVCFFLPNYFWTLMQRQTTLNPASFTEEAEKVSKLFGKEKQDEMRTLASKILSTLSEMSSFFQKRQAGLLYLLTKGLYLVNIYVQYLILTNFLGEDYIHWGYTMAYKLYNGIYEEGSTLFPRVVMCDFKIRTIANPHAYTIQCVLMMNYINEKLYLVLYFWFSFLAIVNGLSCLYQLIMVLVPWLQSRGVYGILVRNKKENKKDVSVFISKTLHPDGALLLDFISRDISSYFSSQLADELYKQHREERRMQDFASEDVNGTLPSTYSSGYEVDIENEEAIQVSNASLHTCPLF